MSKKLTILAVVLGLLVVSCGLPTTYQHKIDLRPECNTQWIGEVDERFVTKVREDLHKAHTTGCEILRASLMSPGGSVVWSVEASQEIKRARQKGLIVEVHGRSLVASGALLVISAGSPNSRYIARNSLVVVHGIQVSGGFMEPPTCVDFDSIPQKKTERDKIVEGILMLIITEVAENTGKPWAETAKLFTCGNERIASGYLLVELGFADKEEN